MATHLAAVSLAKGQPFQVKSRPTPRPGPGELLIAVKSVALNPADGIMRDTGLFIPSYPSVLGFDVSGLVLEVGKDVPTSANDEESGPFFLPGITRVAAYAASVWKGCHPDYGVFQERCIVPWEYAVPLPQEGISWNDAATLPVSVQVPLSAWDAMGIHQPGTREEPSKQKQEIMLIWGASSSVGSMGVQTARLLRDDPSSPFAAVYATAGAANQKYVASLGADRVFDYKEAHVVDSIIEAAKIDGLRIRHCFLAMGQLSQCQVIVKAFAEGEDQKAKIASAPPVPSDTENVDGVEVIWVMPSADEGDRLAQFRYWMGTWLRENLVNKTIRPSPGVEVVGKGLDFVNSGIDMLLQGVSCTKLVVKVAD